MKSTGLLIFRKKKSKISRDFHWKKVKIRGKIGQFHRIFTGESQNSLKNRPISRDFSGKKSNYDGFSVANSKKNRPISQEISKGNFAKKQLVKNSRFPWIFFGGREFSLSRSILRQYDQRFLTFFLTGIIICSFHNSSLEK